MTPEGSAVPPSNIIEELVKTFGHEKVLTDFEDLYVYSSFGEFGIRRRRLPIAVLRLHSEDEEARLAGLIGSLKVDVIRNDETEGDSRIESSDAVVLVDSREPLSASDLARKLAELEEAERQGRKGLRNAPSLPHWFTSLLSTRDAYRIGESSCSDYGFCPVQRFFDGVETYSSKGRLILARGLLRGELKATGKLVDSMYSCTACGQCYDQLTLSGFEIDNAIVRTRHEIVKWGEGPKQRGILTENILENGNPMGMPLEDRTLWFEELSREFPFRSNEVLYWSGCLTAYRLPSIVESTVNILREADVDFGLLGNGEGCCGLILYLWGLWDEARKNATETIRKLLDSGVRMLLTSCAGCYYAFSKVYPTLGVQLPFTVRHTAQFIESLILEGRLELKEIEGSYVWHDPCDLGRHCKVFEPPRRVMRSIPRLELLEPALNRQHALCCGAGGGLWMYNGELTERMAASKLGEEFMPMDVDGVVTGCPSCILNLKYAANSLKLKMTVQDLTELVSRCL